MFRWVALASAVILVVALAGAIVSSQPPVKPSPQQTTEENQKEDSNKRGDIALWDRWFPDAISLYTLFLVVFSAVLAFVSIYQLNFLNRAERIAAISADAAKDAAKAAQRAAEVAEKTLVAGQRAWIRIDEIGLGGGGLAFDQNGASVAISFKITNVGNSPAINITAHAWLIALKNGGPFALQEQERMCKEVRNKPFGIGFTLFPNETFPANMGLGRWSLGTNINSDEVTKGLAISAGGKHVSLQVYGCLDYTFATDPTVHHQTGFIRDLRMKGMTGIGPADGIIPIDQIVLMDLGIGIGQYAD